VSRFQFGLQKVLNLREREEQERARLLAEAEQRAREAEARLDLMQTIRGEEAAKLMLAHTHGKTVGQLRNLGVVVKQLTDHVDKAEQAVREATERVEESRSELLASVQQRRVLDHLKARQQDTWRLVQAGVERKEMDELALEIFQRRIASEQGRGG
jgi:flagellar protein FliJ